MVEKSIPIRNMSTTMFTTMNNNMDSAQPESKNPFDTIESYNQWLVESQTLLAIKEYIMNVRNMFYPTLDISFMDEFMDLCTRTDFCIKHSSLIRYGVVNQNDSSKIKTCMDRNDLIDGVDYQLTQVSELRLQGGSSIKNVYTLTPMAFKMCLIRSKNTRRHVRYYLLLEQCVHYHNMYQLQLSHENNIILEKKCAEYEDIISGNKRLMASLEENQKEQTAQISMILNHLRLAEEEKNHVDAHVQEIVPDRVIRPEDGDKCGSFVLMKIDDDKFYAIRCQKKAVNKSIKAVETKHPGADMWMHINYHPNPVKFWNVIKKRITFVSIKRNTMTLNGSEVALRAAIQELENERLQ